MRKIAHMIFLMTLAYPLSCQNSTEYQKFHPIVNALWQSLNQNEYAALEPYIHEDFTYHEYGGDFALSIMKQVVAGWKSDLTSISIVGVVEVEDKYELKSIFRSSGGDQNHSLTLSKDLKLLKANIANIQLEGHTKQSDQPETTKSFLLRENRPEVVEIPLTLKERDMFVKASINGREGTFFFDTGAPTLILNRAAFEEGELSVKGKLDYDIGGATGAIEDVNKIELLNFEISGMKGTNVEAISYDLSHLDQADFGMIGSDIMKGYLTMFDLKNLRIRMFKLDENGNPKDPSVLKGFEPIKIKMLQHVPIITVEIAGQKLNLVVDSGASSAMINPKYRELLIGQYDFLKKDILRGAGKEERNIEVFNLRELSFANKTYQDVKVIFENVGEQRHGDQMGIDGLIGWDIFYESVVAYNLERGLIYIKK